jgi:hypothetical protein
MEGWTPPVPAGAHVHHTRTWRLVDFGKAEDRAPRLFVAVAAQHLPAAYERVFPLLADSRVSHRHARSVDVLQAYADHPWWAGKALVVEPLAGEAAHLPGQLDALLAEAGLVGPVAVAGAKPFGGRSGLVFLESDLGDSRSGAGAEVRRQRLAQLLNV